MSVSSNKFCLTFAILCCALTSNANAQNANLSWANQVIQNQRDHGTDKSPVVTAVSLRPGGAMVATAGDDHIVRIWNVVTGSVVRKLEGHDDWVRTVAYSPDGSVLATAGNGREIILWDADSGQRIKTLAQHDHAIQNIAYSHDGRMLASTGFENRLRVYDTQNGNILHELSCPCRDMRAIAFSPDDRILAAGGRSGLIRLYEVETGRDIRDIAAHRQRIREMQFTGEGQYLISCSEDRTVRISNVAGTDVFELPRRPTKIMSIALCGATRLATAGSDNLIRIWDLNTRSEIGQLRGHTGTVTALASNGDILVSGSYDTTVRVWKVQNAVSNEVYFPADRGSNTQRK